MNVGLWFSEPGFLESLRNLCDANGALLIFDEVETGAKLAWGGASEYFGVKPAMICLAKSIGGGLPLGAFGASKKVMGLISDHKVFHGGTYNTNRAAMSAGLAAFREVLTRENYVHVGKLSKKLTEGYRAIVKKAGLALMSPAPESTARSCCIRRKSKIIAIGPRSMSTSGATIGSPW